MGDRRIVLAVAFTGLTALPLGQAGCSAQIPFHAPQVSRIFSPRPVAENPLVVPTSDFDTVWNKTSARALHALCQGAEELWCEACYLHSQLAKAREHLHLTARQAGRLAAEAGVGKLHLFHFSRRYQGGEAHLEEARQFFSATEPGRVYFDGPPR